MKEVAKLQIKDRTELFQATAISMRMQPNVIEKDFWVYYDKGNGIWITDGGYLTYISAIKIRPQRVYFITSLY